MKNEIRTYKVKLRVITPLFVWSGKVINRSQYIDFKDKHVGMINGQKLIRFLSEYKVLNEYEKYIFHRQKKSYRFI